MSTAVTLGQARRRSKCFSCTVLIFALVSAMVDNPALQRKRVSNLCIVQTADFGWMLCNSHGWKRTSAVGKILLLLWATTAQPAKRTRGKGHFLSLMFHAFALLPCLFGLKDEITHFVLVKHHLRNCFEPWVSRTDNHETRANFYDLL